MVVSSALVSYAGATSTISAETMCRPSSPLRIVRSSRVDQPPVSGVPVAGANAGSMESIWTSVRASQCPPSRRSGNGTHVDGEIHRLISHGVADFLYDTIGSYTGAEGKINERTSTSNLAERGRTYGVYLTGLDALEAGRVIVCVVSWPGECSADGAML